MDKTLIHNVRAPYPMSRLKAWLRVFCLFALVVLSVLWLQTEGRFALVSNVTLIKLVGYFVALPPPQAAEMLGISCRSSLLASNADILLADARDRIRSPRLLLAIYGLVGQPRTIELPPRIATTDVMAQFWLAYNYGQQHRPDMAIETLRHVAGMDEYFSLAGINEYQLGRYERAMQLLETATMLDHLTSQSRSRTYENLVVVAYQQLGDWDRSVFYSKQWIQVLPRDTGGYTQLASLYLWHDQPEEAYQVLQQGEPYGVSSNRFYPIQMGHIWSSRGDWQKAVQFYHEGWRQNKDDPYLSPHIALSLGNALYHEGQLEEACFYLKLVQRSGGLGLQERAIELLTEIGDGGCR